MKFSFVFAFLVCFQVALWSNPELKFYHLTHEQGLSQSTVNCILKDHQGLFWFGTNNGLNRWNGYEFEIFYHIENDPKSVALGRINVLFEDENKVLWIGTSQGGLSRYIPESNSFESYTLHNNSKTNSQFNITGIVSYADELLVSTFDKGLFYFDKQTLVFSSVLIYDEKGNPISSLTDARLQKTNDGVLWLIAYNEGVCRIFKDKTTSKGESLRIERFLAHENVLDVYQDKNQNYWFGTYESGAYRMDSQTGEFFQLKHGKADSYHLNHPIVRRFMEDREGNLWIGTGGGGVNIYNPSTQKISYYTPHLGNIYAINSNIIYSIFRDEEMNLWIGTYNGGISYTSWHKQSFNHIRSFGSEGELNNNAILSFCEDPAGRLWIGTDGGGINVYDPVTGNHRLIDNPKLAKPKVITSLKADSKGNIYIGTYRNGLLVYNYYSGIVRAYTTNNGSASLNNNDVWDIVLSKDENTIWLATLGGGLNKIDLKTNQVKWYTASNNEPNSITDDFLSCLWLDSDENLWIGTYHEGILRMPASQEGSFESFRKDTLSKLSSNEIRVIFEDSKKRILAGTLDGGLNLFNAETKSFYSYTIADGLPGNTIQSILEDADGNIWIGTNNGLSRLNIFETSLMDLENFAPFDGLQAYEYNLHSSFKTRDGMLCFGGVNGYNAFYPHEIEEGNKVGKIVLTRFFIFDVEMVPGGQESPQEKSLMYTQRIELKHSQSTISFAFAMLDYTVPEYNTYEFRLKGFDKEWVKSGTRRLAKYTNLDPGEYQFEVRGLNRQGMPAEASVSVSVYIAPPFYQTPFFRFLLILSVVLILLSIYRFRVRSLRIQGELLKSTVEERTKELRMLNRVLEQQNTEINKQSEELIAQQHNLVEANQKLEGSYRRIEHQNIELAEHRNNLESIVKERTVELEQAKLKAEESEQLKMAFLSNMSHEIRTPMNAIVGFASLLADDTLTAKERQEYIQQVNTNSDSLLILIDDILDLSKIEANQLRVKTAVFEVNTFANELYFNWKHLQLGKKAEIVFELKNQLPAQDIFIHSDEIRLKQIMNNLLDNAFKFTDHGSIVLEVKHEQNEIIFSVTDSGIGISHENLHLIFNRFRKAEETGKKLYRGAGLGLTISNRLAKMLNGRLWVSSSAGKGSSFHLALPITDEDFDIQIKDIQPIKEVSDADYAALRILVAEDEETNYNYLYGILKKKGVKVDWACDGEEALRMNAVSSYDIILMDIKMPVMDGMEATRRIKEMFPNQIIIAQTAFARPEEELEFRKAGFDDYIAKPIKSEDLLAMIAKFMPSV
ncbi:MAG: response regulator [Bacteroidota bacterium]|nr:MAG: response regulator [Bacteroidota bacterium]